MATAKDGPVAMLLVLTLTPRLHAMICMCRSAVVRLTPPLDSAEQGGTQDSQLPLSFVASLGNAAALPP